MNDQPRRLITRGDFDGVVCAMLLKQKGIVGDDILFVHPKEMQDGKVPVTENDVMANLPFVPGAHLAFDHHSSEFLRLAETHENYIFDMDAPSAAQVIYRHYGGADAFPTVPPDLMAAVNRADSAQFTKNDILNPQGWMLIHFLTDPRTGLGRVQNFQYSTEQLFLRLIGFCGQYGAEQILALPEFQERLEVYNRYRGPFQEQIKRCAKVQKDLVVINLISEQSIIPGNRFLVYALYPQCSMSIQAAWSDDKSKIIFAAGKSIFNHGCVLHIGELMLRYGGGGHAGAGTCQIEPDKAAQVIQEMIHEVTAEE